MDKFVKLFFGIIVGALEGAGAASLLTPKNGEEIREGIRNSFDEIRLDYELGRQKKRDELEAEIKRRWEEE